jgi:hypothetical protein
MHVLGQIAAFASVIIAVATFVVLIAVTFRLWRKDGKF